MGRHDTTEGGTTASDVVFDNVPDTPRRRRHHRQQPAPDPPAAPSRTRNVKRGDLTLDQFMAGLRQTEHGGSYDWAPNSIGARGAYQFMSYEAWAQEAGVNPNDHSPAAQDAVAAFKIRQYLHAYHGNWGMVAAAWFGGPGGAHAWATGSDPSDGAINTSEYVNRVLTNAGSANPAQYTQHRSGGGGDIGSGDPMSVKSYLHDPAVAQDYGYLLGYLHDPELGPILARAAKHGWSEDRLFGAISQTDWWKHTSASERAWERQKQLDPASAQQRLNQRVRDVQQLAMRTLGLRLDDKRAQTIGVTSIASDWSEAQLQAAVGAEFHYHANKAPYGGAAGQTVDRVKQMASDYLIPLANHTIDAWTRRVLKGNADVGDFESYLKDQAKSLYPTLGSAIDGGMTVKQYLDPYAQLWGQTLEKDPAEINWMHPKWMKALNTTTPDGQRAPMSLSDWATYLRGTREYQSTKGATDSAYQFANTLAQTFGKVSE